MTGIEVAIGAVLLVAGGTGAAVYGVVRAAERLASLEVVQSRRRRAKRIELTAGWHRWLNTVTRISADEAVYPGAPPVSVRFTVGPVGASAHLAYRGAAPPALRVQLRDLGTGLLPPRATGDPEFDRLFYADPPVLATARVRTLLLERGGLTVKISGGTISATRELWVWRGEPDRDVAWIRTLYAALPTTLDDALEESAAVDPVPGIRAYALEVLHRRDPHRAAPFVRRGLDSGVPEVELVAAKASGDVRRLERLARGASVSFDLRRRAIAVLIALRADDAVRRSVSDSVLRDPQEAVLELVRVLASSPTIGAFAGLGQLYRYGRIATAEPHARQRIGRAVAELAFRIGPHPEVESTLVAMLSEPDASVRAAAAQALAHVGTVAAVAPLREAQLRAGLLDRTTDLAELAIAAIKGRARGEAGALALASLRPEHGALSELTGFAGRLSED